jgi:hypothetical protein
MAEKKLPYVYKCPECGLSVSVLSNTYPPVCSNPKEHTLRSIEMVLQNEQHRASQNH